MLSSDLNSRSLPSHTHALPTHPPPPSLVSDMHRLNLVTHLVRKLDDDMSDEIESMRGTYQRDGGCVSAVQACGTGVSRNVDQMMT